MLEWCARVEICDRRYDVTMWLLRFVRAFTTICVCLCVFAISWNCCCPFRLEDLARYLSHTRHSFRYLLLASIGWGASKCICLHWRQIKVALLCRGLCLCVCVDATITDDDTLDTIQLFGLCPRLSPLKLFHLHCEEVYKRLRMRRMLWQTHIYTTSHP